ncbi:MAG: nucleotidyltransferase family protein [bacterium]
MRNINEIKELIAKIKKHLIARYNDSIKKVIVYGSFARGDATEDSDIDLAIVIADDLDSGKVEEEPEDLLFSILLDERELVSALVIPESMFKNYRSPVILSTKEEGISV